MLANARQQMRIRVPIPEPDHAYPVLPLQNLAAEVGIGE
jgi:hypothetical protein